MDPAHRCRTRYCLQPQSVSLDRSQRQRCETRTGGILTGIGRPDGIVAPDGERARARRRLELRPPGTVVGGRHERRRPDLGAQRHRVGRARPRADPRAHRLQTGAEDGEVLVRQHEGDAGVVAGIEARRGLPDVGELRRGGGGLAGRMQEEHEAGGVGRLVFDGDVERVDGHGVEWGAGCSVSGGSRR